MTKVTTQKGKNAMTCNYFIEAGELLVLPAGPTETPERLYNTYLCIRTEDGMAGRVVSLNPEDMGKEWDVTQDKIKLEESTKLTLWCTKPGHGLHSNTLHPHKKVYPCRPMRFDYYKAYEWVEAGNKVYEMLTNKDTQPYNTDPEISFYFDALRKLILQNHKYREFVGHVGLENGAVETLTSFISTSMNNVKSLLRADAGALERAAMKTQRALTYAHKEEKGERVADALSTLKSIRNKGTLNTSVGTDAIEKALAWVEEAAEIRKNTDVLCPDDYMPLTLATKELRKVGTSLLAPVEEWHSTINKLITIQSPEYEEALKARQRKSGNPYHY